MCGRPKNVDFSIISTQGKKKKQASFLMSPQHVLQNCTLSKGTTCFIGARHCVLQLRTLWPRDLIESGSQSHMLNMNKKWWKWVGANGSCAALQLSFLRSVWSRMWMCCACHILWPTHKTSHSHWYHHNISIISNTVSWFSWWKFSSSVHVNPICSHSLEWEEWNLFRPSQDLSRLCAI